MKDRHSKVRTAKGLRDRRVRLSAPTAVQFFDIQDRLGYEQPSKAVDWLLENASAAINQLRSGTGAAAAASGDPRPNYPAAAAAAAVSDHNLLPPFPNPCSSSAEPSSAANLPLQPASVLRRHSDIETPPSDLSPHHSKQPPPADRPKRRLSSSSRNPLPAPAQRRASDDPRHAHSESSPSADHDRDDSAATPAYPKFSFQFQRHHWVDAPGLGHDVRLLNPVGQSMAAAHREPLPIVDGTRRAKARERARERVMKERSAAVPDVRPRQSGTTFNGRKLPATSAGDSTSAADRSAAAAAAMIVNRATDHGYHHGYQEQLIRQQAQLMDHYGARPDPILNDHDRLPEYDAAADLQIHGDLGAAAGAAASPVVHSAAARLQPSSSAPLHSIYSSTADEILRQYNLHQATSSLNTMRRRSILQTASIMEQQSGAGDDRDHHSGGAMNLSSNASGGDAAYQHYLYPAGTASNLVGGSSTFLQQDQQHYNTAIPFAASSMNASPQFYRQQQQQQLNGGGAASSSSPARGTLQSMNFMNANYNVTYNYTGQGQSNNLLLQQYINYQQQAAQLVNAAANQAAAAAAAAAAGVSDDERQRRQRQQINLQDMLAEMDPPTAAAAVINLNQASQYATPRYTHLNAAAAFGDAAGGEASAGRYAAKNEESEEENDRKQQISEERKA